MTGTRRGHRALPHTADVILEAWGPDIASCCEEAVAALVDAYAIGRGETQAERVVHVPPAPAEELLLDVLEEVIFALDTAELVPVGASVDGTESAGFDMVLRFDDRSAVEPTGALPKAVSRSGLRVVNRPGRVSCRFIVDL